MANPAAPFVTKNEGRMQPYCDGYHSNYATQWWDDGKYANFIKF